MPAPGPRKAEPQSERPRVPTLLAEAAARATGTTLPPGRPYLKAAFANLYNLTLLLAGLSASALTLDPVPALVTLAFEGLWLLHAPDSRFLRRVLWDPLFERAERALRQAEMERRLGALPEGERGRARALLERQQEILRLAARNPTFTAELLRSELGKTETLADAFLELARTCARYEEYLRSVDAAALDRARARFESETRKAQDDPNQDEIARKNLAVILKRLDKLREIRRYLGLARGQLDLIENSFQLIADQIVTLQSPRELSGQLDELLDGVQAVKETASEAESLLGPIAAEVQA